RLCTCDMLVIHLVVFFVCCIAAYYVLYDLLVLCVDSNIFFVLLIQRAPGSTLFPYTTLFRSYIDYDAFDELEEGLGRFHASWNRSEEHTSELQSRFDLVCRLLLEKKNAQWSY